MKDGEAGVVRISASHPAHGYTHREFRLPTVEQIVLQMESPGQIAGVLTENGRPPLPGKWSVVLEPRFRSGRGAVPDLPKLDRPGPRRQLRRDRSAPGNYRLRAVKSLSTLTSPAG